MRENFHIWGNASLFLVEASCQCQAKSLQLHACTTRKIVPWGASVDFQMASALRLLQLESLEAEVEYANRKPVLLLRALNPIDGDSERAADEIATAARSPFARLTSVNDIVVLTTAPSHVDCPSNSNRGCDGKRTRTDDLAISIAHTDYCGCAPFAIGDVPENFELGR